MNKVIEELIEQATTKEEFYPAGCNGYPEYRYDFDPELLVKLTIERVLSLIVEEQYKVDQHWQCKDGIHISWKIKDLVKDIK